MKNDHNNKHHILITGPGRAGTTFLVQLLTLLGLDTGYTKDLMPVDSDSNAGLEHQGLGEDLPYIIKNPKLMWQLPGLLKSKPVVIDHIILPLRNIDEVIASRIENLSRYPDLPVQDVIGGLEGVDDPSDQKHFFLKNVYQFLEFISAFDIPVTILQYPRLAIDGEYLFQKIGNLFDGIQRITFLEAYQNIANPSLVHEYHQSHKHWLDFDGVDGNINLHNRENPSSAEIISLRKNLQQLRTEFSKIEQHEQSLQAELAKLQQHEQSLQAELVKLHQHEMNLQQSNRFLSEDNNRLLSSRSWRYTRPLRLMMCIFRRDKQPLYDEVGQLRDSVYLHRQRCKVSMPFLSRYLIEPVYFCIKRFLKPLLRRLFHTIIGRIDKDVDCTHIMMQHASAYEEDQDFSQYKSDLKAIVFYSSFSADARRQDGAISKWQTIKQARPLFAGHYQPRIPHYDVGCYDANDINVMKMQAELARRHGIYGFCFTVKSCNGQHKLEKPLVDAFLEHPDIDINYCVCWANEGQESTEISTDRIVSYIEAISRYFKDPRYIKLNGKPVVLVHSTREMEELQSILKRWRDHCCQKNIGEIDIWLIGKCFNETMESVYENGFEALVEFPSYVAVDEASFSPLYGIDKLTRPLVDYAAMVKNGIDKSSSGGKSSLPTYRTVLLGLDQTPLKGSQGHVSWGFSTHLYYKWLKYIIEDTRKKFSPDKRFLFIKSWNDWSEGTYLEPDEKYGYANINTTSKALFDLPFSFKPPEKSESGFCSNELEIAELIMDPAQFSATASIAVHAHVYHTDLIHELVHYMNNIPVDYDCIITTDTEMKKRQIFDVIEAKLNAKHIEIRITPNIGRDVAPFLVGCKDLAESYDYICHIHTKKSAHGNFGDYWRDHLLDYLLGSKKLVAGILDLLQRNRNIGMVYPPLFSHVEPMAVWGENEEKVIQLLKKIGIDRELPDKPVFPGGTMMWIRTKAFEQLFNAGFEYEHFENEQGQLDGTLAHAFERSLVYIAEHHGYTSVRIAS